MKTIEEIEYEAQKLTLRTPEALIADLVAQVSRLRAQVDDLECFKQDTIEDINVLAEAIERIEKSLKETAKAEETT